MITFPTAHLIYFRFNISNQPSNFTSYNYYKQSLPENDYLYTISPLKIFLWNPNGLHQHKNEPQTVLYNHKNDISLLTEAQFTAKSNFKIHNYTLYRSDHPDVTAHAGSCILVSNSIQHNVLIP